MKRVIFHVDQNCYFASVEMIAHPEYRNVPMAVAGDAEKRHGIILAKNQLASAAGVKTAEVIWQAKLKCPDLVLAPSHYEKYEFYSRKLREMYMEYTDRVEPFGLDECWLDVTDVIGGRDPKDLADEIRQRVREEFHLTCSVGVSFNKIFAKLGSDYKKPDATTVITEENFRDIVWPLPCSDLLFVGKSTAQSLNKINIKTIGDLAAADREFLISYIGKNGQDLWMNANGLDESEVRTSDYRRTVKSVGNSSTTATDMTSISEISSVYHTLSSSVAARLRRHKLKGNVIQITVRDKDLKIYEKQKILFRPTDNAGDIYEAAMDLFKSSYDWHSGVRSIGVRLTGLTAVDAPEQLSLFDEVAKDSKTRKLDETIDLIRDRYGKDSLKVCAEFREPDKEPDSGKNTFVSSSDNNIDKFF